MTFKDTISSDVASAEAIFQRLSTSAPICLNMLPNSHGIYALVDHAGAIRYIGVTASPSVGFHNRIFSRHVAGSEGRSHKFSHAYNTGRMWQAPGGYHGQLEADAKLAKKIRAEFCRTYCKAVYVELPRDGFEEAYFHRLTRLEKLVQAMAPSDMRLWEGRNFPAVEEPSALLDQLLDRLEIGQETKAALARQKMLHDRWQRSMHTIESQVTNWNDICASLNIRPARPVTTNEISCHGALNGPVAPPYPAINLTAFNEGEIKSMQNSDWYVMRPQKAQAYGRPVADGFLVRKGSTAMVNGSPLKKRDRHERDRLVRQGVLVPHVDPELFVFSRDHVFNSASLAGGIVKDGNCSGPQSWKHAETNTKLADAR